MTGARSLSPVVAVAGGLPQRYVEPNGEGASGALARDTKAAVPSIGPFEVSSLTSRPDPRGPDFLQHVDCQIKLLLQGRQ